MLNSIGFKRMSVGEQEGDRWVTCRRVRYIRPLLWTSSREGLCERGTLSICLAVLRRARCRKGVRGEVPEVAGCLRDMQIKLETISIDNLSVNVEVFSFFSFLGGGRFLLL